MGALLDNVDSIVGQDGQQAAPASLSGSLDQALSQINNPSAAQPSAPLGGFWQNVGQTLTLPAKELVLGAKQHILDPLTNVVNSALPDWAQKKLEEANKNLGLAATPEEAQKNTNKLIEDTRKYYSKVLQTPGGQVGYGVGTIGTALAGGTVLKFAGMPELGAAIANPSTFKQAAATGAALGGLQPTIGDENALTNAGQGAIWGTLGQGVVKGISGLAHPVESALGDLGTKAVQVLKDNNIPLDAAQTTGSVLLKRVKSALGDNPITAGGQNAFSQIQQEAFNRAVAKTMGENASVITPEVIQSAKDRIGQVYENVASKTGIHVTPDYQAGLNDLLQNARLQLNDQQYGVIERNVGNILDKANANGGFISGDQYRNIKSGLDGISMGSDQQVGSFARDLRDYVNQGLNDTAKILGDTKSIADLKEANKQWGNMRKIENVTIGKNEGGDISPSRLFNSLGTKANRYSFYQDDPQLAKLAQAGKLILPDKLPNSGTTARLTAQGLINLALPGAIGGAAGGLYQGNWQDAAKGAALGVALPKALQYGMNNPAFINYLSQGLPATTFRNVAQKVMPQTGSLFPNIPLRNLLNVPEAVGASRIPLSLINAQKQANVPE